MICPTVMDAAGGKNAPALPVKGENRKAPVVIFVRVAINSLLAWQLAAGELERFENWVMACYCLRSLINVLSRILAGLFRIMEFRKRTEYCK
jgi:hypothetical protein